MEWPIAKGMGFKERLKRGFIWDALHRIHEHKVPSPWRIH